MFTLQINYPVRDYEAFNKYSTAILQAAPPRAPGLSPVPGYRGPEQRRRLLDFDTRMLRWFFLNGFAGRCGTTRR